MFALSGRIICRMVGVVSLLAVVAPSTSGERACHR